MNCPICKNVMELIKEQDVKTIIFCAIDDGNINTPDRMSLLDRHKQCVEHFKGDTCKKYSLQVCEECGHTHDGIYGIKIIICKSYEA